MRGISKTYALKRGAMFLVTVWLGMTLIFVIPRLAPGDPVSAMISRLSAQGARVENSAELIKAWRERFGLDAPMGIQYLRFLRNSVTFDFGYSMNNFPAPVNEMVARALPWTICLLLTATIIAFVLGNVIGALMAWRKTPRALKAALPFCLVFTSIPPFMLGILLIYLFAYGLRWLPLSGAFDRGLAPGFHAEMIFSVIRHTILPAMAIVLTQMGYWALGMRAMMINNAGEDYMLLAEAKGLRSGRIFWMYEIRNAALPQFTALALSLGSIAGGAIIVEYIFNYPGMGFLLYQAIVNNDYSLIQGIVLILITGVALGVLIIDLLYPLIDPRIAYEKR